MIQLSLDGRRLYVTNSLYVGGIPIEEMLASLGPALLLVVGAASARLSALIRKCQHRGQRRARAGHGTMRACRR